MRRSTVIWLIIAALLVVTGSIIFTGAMTMVKWDFSKLSTSKYETNTYKIDEDFTSISVDTNTAKISFTLSSDSSCSVICREEENMKHSVQVRDGSLMIEVIDKRSWYQHIGINFGSPEITVCIPKGEYGSLTVKTDTGDVMIPKELSFKSMEITASTANVTSLALVSDKVRIKTSTGDIRVEGISPFSLDLSASTGRISVSDVRCKGDITVKVSTGNAYLTNTECKSLISTGSTGKTILKQVIVLEKLSVERSTGDVELDSCDAAEIYIKTDTGDVKGSLLSDKVFITETDTGKIKVPSSAEGGRCEITTDTGDIIIEILGNS